MFSIANSLLLIEHFAMIFIGSAYLKYHGCARITFRTAGPRAASHSSFVVFIFLAPFSAV
jgi:hypothetical protein